MEIQSVRATGVPVRIAIGPKDLEGSVEVARRDTLTKQFMQQDEVARPPGLLDEIQLRFLRGAILPRKMSQTADTWEEFKALMKGNPGFVYAHWDGTTGTEDKIKDLTKATIRCIPLNNKQRKEIILTGKPSTQRVVFAKAYQIKKFDF